MQGITQDFSVFSFESPRFVLLREPVRTLHRWDVYQALYPGNGLSEPEAKRFLLGIAAWCGDKMRKGAFAGTMPGKPLFRSELPRVPDCTVPGAPETEMRLGNNAFASVFRLLRSMLRRFFGRTRSYPPARCLDLPEDFGGRLFCFGAVWVRTV